MTIKTVGELRKQLEGFDDDMQVAVYLENSENGPSVYQIIEATPAAGASKRLSNGGAGFTFDREGPETWMLVSIETA